jgi:hypothetical protein
MFVRMHSADGGLATNRATSWRACAVLTDVSLCEPVRQEEELRN